MQISKKKLVLLVQESRVLFCEGASNTKTPIFVLFGGTRLLKLFQLNKSPLCNFSYIYIAK